MAGPRQGDRLRPLALWLALRRPRAHPPRPVLVVVVADDERQRRPERPAVPEPGEHLDPVLLDLLARRAAVALLPPLQVRVDPLALEHEARRHAGEDRDERRPVRLPRGCETKRHRRQSIRADRGPHDLDRRRDARPELEALRALAHERLEPVDHLAARRPRGRVSAVSALSRE